MLNLIQVAFGGVLLGGIYALAALGLSLSFGVLRILNIAHGDFLMLGALTSYWIFSLFKINPFLIVFIVIPIFFLAGILFERLLVRPIAARPPQQLAISSILVTLGASLAIEDAASFIWGPEIKGIAYSLPSLKLGGLIIPTMRLAALGFIALLTLGIHLFLKYSYSGRAVRAITQEREGAMLVGINIPRISMLVFGLGSALAAAAGVFHATLFTISPFIGIPLTLKYLVIIILGGLGSIVGTLVGAIILGVAEAITGIWPGGDWSPGVAIVILIVILMIRPEGLFGRS